MAGSDSFVTDETPKSQSSSDKDVRMKTLIKSAYNPNSHEFNEAFTPGDIEDPMSCKTVHEVVACLEKNKEVKIEGNFFCVNKERRIEKRKITDKASFVEAFKKNEARFKEGGDSFSVDSGSTNTGDIGNDFIPVLGGPFNKQLYSYDFLKATAACFWAVNHDPIARRIVETIVQFTLGKGFQVRFKNAAHSALWDAFEEANDFYTQFYFYGRELSTYGESMWYWLPNNDTKIIWNKTPTQQELKGIIPRIRVIDPTMVWDYITWPEDITNVLAYQIVSPMQYQIYTKVDGSDKVIPGTKFIFQQLPAEKVIHTRINCMSNEKRGRGDLFSVLGYLKRLRDSVNYAIVALQKNAAWAIDTTVDGNQTDIDNYVSDQQALGTIPDAGSEFVHTKAITRQYLSNQGQGRGGDSPAFEWCLSMIAAGSGIPTQYFGTHLSGAQTRASAVVGIEPVARLFEMRQRVYEGALNKIIRQFFRSNGIEDVDYSIIWPEIITQDRSQKLKDLGLAQTMKWISPQRAGATAAKELGQDDYSFAQEQKDIKSEQDAQPPEQAAGNGPGASDNPLTKPGLENPVKNPVKPSAVTGPEKVNIKRNYGT